MRRLLAAAFVVASLAAMVVTVTGAERATWVLWLEVGTWVVATVGVAGAIAGPRRGGSHPPVATGRSGSELHPDHDPT